MQATPNFDFTVVKSNDKSLGRFVGMLTKIYQNLTKVINGNLGFGDGTKSDNIDGVWINVTAPVAPNTDFTVTHNLGRIPVGYWAMQKDRACDIYTGSVAATKTQLTLRAAAASAVLRLFVVGILLMFSSFAIEAQTTNITLQVTDASGQSWNNGTWTATLSSPPGVVPFGPPFFIINTSTPVPNQIQTGALSSSGSATMTLTQNAGIAPSKSQWLFSVCSQATSTNGCFTQFVTITSTTTVNLTPPTISVQAGPGARAYVDTEVIAGAGLTYYNVTGQVLRLCQVDIAGFCTTWTNSGGGGIPGGLTTQTQVNLGGVFSGTGCQTFPDNVVGPINQDCDVHDKGPNPWIDVSRYTRIPPTGAPSTSSVTANCVNGNTSVVLSGTGSTLFQNGDGIALAGCGSTHSMATPTLTSVTPSGVRTFSGVNDTVPLAAASTTYNYKIYVVNSTGGYTAASAPVSTTTGAATLGSTTINLTSASRANNVDSFITSSAHTLVVGMKVVLIGQSDATFNGECQVATTADNTHFTCNRGIDTRNGTNSIVATGGTVTYFVGNKLVWSVPGSPNGEYQYVVCTDRGTPGTFNALGMALPLSSPTSLLSDSSLSFEDYGATISGGMTSQIPWYLPTSPCPSSAGNNILATTVATVAGSTVTLNAAPSASLTSTARIDATPGLLVAAAASATGTTRAALHFPIAPLGAALVINSPLDFRTVSGWTGLIDNPGGFIVNAPVIFPTDHVTFKGTVTLANASADSFQMESLPTTTVNCFACLFFPNANSLSIQGNRIAGSGTNGALPILINGGFGQTIQHNIFTTNGANSDFSGIAIWFRGANTLGISKTIFTNNLITSGPANGFDTTSATPNFVCTACSTFHAADDFWVHRGALWRAIGTAHQINIDGGHYINGGNQPLFNITGDNITAGNTGVTVTVEHVQMDTIPHAVLNYLPSAGTVGATAILRDPGTPSSGLPILTGAPFTHVIGQAIQTELGQNFNVTDLTNNNFSDGAVTVDGLGVVGYALTNPAAPSCVVSAGGNVPVQSWTYNIYAIDANGNFSKASPSITCVTTSGQQTVTITPPSRPSGSVTYQAARNGQLVVGGASRWTSNIVDTFGFTAGNPGNPTGLQAGINTTNVQAPQLVLTGGGFKDVQSGVFTGDRATSWPDVNGVVIKSSVVNSVYDNFNRANETPLSGGGKWTIGNGSWNLTSNTAAPATGGARNLAFWNANTFSSDQFSQITITTIGSHIGAAVRATTGNDYSCEENTTTLLLLKLSGGTESTLTSVGVTGVNGDVIRAEVQGNQLSCYQNNVLKLGPFTDNSFSSGQPGVYAFSNTTALDNWSGGNLHPIAQLDAEQDWTQTQHIQRALTVGPTAPIAGALTDGNIYGTQANLTGAVSTGATPPACVVGTAGAWCANDGTAPGTIPAGTSAQWPDSVTNSYLYNANNNGASAFSGSWNCTNVTPVTVTANVTTDQNLMTCSIPAGILNRALRTMKVSLAGVYSTPAASTTAVTIKVKVGALTVATWTSTALAGIQATNDQFNIQDAKFTVQTAGATASFEAHGSLIIDLGVGNTVADSVFADVNTATVGTIDLTASQTLQVTIAFSVASASNSATERQLVLETVN